MLVPILPKKRNTAVIMQDLNSSTACNDNAAVAFRTPRSVNTWSNLLLLSQCEQGFDLLIF